MIYFFSGSNKGGLVDHIHKQFVLVFSYPFALEHANEHIVNLPLFLQDLVKMLSMPMNIKEGQLEKDKFETLEQLIFDIVKKAE